MTIPFPRDDDSLGHAWGVQNDRPELIWERFSPSYETQAEALWKCLEDRGLAPSLDWAGSEDGEAIIGRNPAGDIVILFHLEDPDQALILQTAHAHGKLGDLIEQTIKEMKMGIQSEAP